MSSSCSHVLPSSITASGVVEESSLSCSPSNDGMSLFSLCFSLSLFFSMTITVSASSCCHCCCCSCVLPSSITASGVVEESLLSCSLSNDGTSLFSLCFLLSLFFSMTITVSVSSCCHRCCCSCALPSSITASGVVEESSLSCSPSNDGMSLFSLCFSLSLFFSMTITVSASSCCHCCFCSRALPSSITASGVVMDGSSSSKNGDDEPNPKSESESSDILIDVR